MELKWFVIENERHKGIPKGAVRIHDSGWGNGYAAVPPDHPWWGKGYDEIDHDLLSLPNEITLSKAAKGLFFDDPNQVSETDKLLAELARDDWWIFGFDTAHFGMTKRNWPKERVEKENKMVDAKTLGGLLFGIHKHADSLFKKGVKISEKDKELILNTSEIIYREEDIIALLKALGFPEPEWGKSISLDQFKAKEDERKANSDRPEVSY